MDQSPDPATDADNEASSDEEHQEQQGQQQQQEGAAFLGKQEEGEEKRAAAEEEQVPPPPPPLPLDYREDWERNQPDFRGKASFDLILRRIEASTGKLRKPGEVTPSTIVEPKKEEDPATTTDSQKKENVKDAATQTPTLSSPYDPGLRRVLGRGRARPTTSCCTKSKNPHPAPSRSAVGRPPLLTYRTPA